MELLKIVLGIILAILKQLTTDPIKNYVVSPIKRHVSYAFKSDSKVQELQVEVEQLQNKKDRLQQSADDATRNGDGIFPNVTKWLTTAENHIREADQIIQGKEEAKNKCFFGFCPSLKARYQLSKIADKKASAIRKLRNEEGLESVSFQLPLQQIVVPSVYNREALPSRMLMLNQVMDALKDPNLNMIGVYGMGGVGKTTLAKEVHAKALQEKIFENVVMVAVSQAPEMRRIQGEIADFLGIKLYAEEIPGRASQIHKVLEKSKVLIILDDLWQKLDLNGVGIPSQVTSMESCCKIMLTSRNRDLLSNEMRAQKLLSLEALEEEETLSLFQMSVAEAKDPEFQAIATQIAKKCAGLPLLIQIVATELTNKESFEWNNKLNQLSAFGDEEIYEKVYKVLESSYENLPGNEIKSFFLLCALFGQSNIQIHHLLAHSMGLGLFKRIRTVEAARDNLLTWINKLKGNSLLMDGDMAGFVKIHDVIRDTALSIASREQHAFVGEGEVRFVDWPNKDCTRISLPFCNASKLPVGLDYPEVELFFLFTEDLSLNIPDSFFVVMKKLKVVDIRGTRMVSLPSSIGLLTNLQTLCLHKCRLDNAAVLGELKQLELLSFAGSDIVELPRKVEALTQLKLLDMRDCSNLQVIPASVLSKLCSLELLSFAESKIIELPREIEVLTQLKLLDLRNCSSLQVIPEGVLSKLCSLEELYILNSFVRWGSKGNVSLMELESLSHLFTLEIEIVNPEMIPIGFKWFSQLRKYKISIGQVWDWQGQHERSRTLKLKVDAGGDFEDGTKSLLRETEDLYLDGMTGIESLFYDGSPKLKHLHVENDFGIQHLIKSTMQASFPELETLYLNRLHKMEKFCSGQLGLGSFGKLRNLSVSSCDKLNSLFSFSSAKCLLQLRGLVVWGCKIMEAVFGEGSEDKYCNNEVIEFTQLSYLKLLELPHLTGFCKIKEGTEHMRLLFNKMVCFPNLTSLEVDRCRNLKHIFTASMVKCLMQLKKLRISDCDLVEEIIESKKMEEEEEEEEEDSTRTIVFPELDSLTLEGLPNLKRLSSFVGKVPGNESEESLFNEMVTFPILETLHIDGIESIKYLWDERFIADDSFSKLKSITIRYCSKLSVVFPSKICTRFQRVEWLQVSECDRVEEIYQSNAYKETQNAFSLRDLFLSYLPSLKHIWNCKDAECGAFSPFQNLRSVEVWSCNNLKYVFPASVGCGLLQLHKLDLQGCNELKVMIEREKDDETSAPSFQFPELTELRLMGLKEMRSLYEGGPHSFHCPKLKILDIISSGCSDISIEKFIFNVEEMALDDQSFHALIHHNTDYSAELCTKLKKVTLVSFDEGTSIDIVFGFLSRIKSLELLVLSDSSFEEIFSQRPIGDGQHHCLRLKHLELLAIKTLKHITKEYFQHLQTLDIIHCNDLMSIAPSSTSLHNLTTLHLGYCHNVTYLVTTSTAKTMVQLMEMKVEKCGMIKEIVAKDEDGTEHGEIIFNKLQCLELTSLPNLNSFCSKMHTFGFPLLEQVTIKQCPRMKIFCDRVISTPKLRGIVFEGEQHWEGNINDTISSQLREWVGDHLEEGKLFQNLVSLKLVNNAFCSTAISTNQILFLNKLRNITVRDCNSIEVVFDLESDVGLLPKLNELNLINLPMLKQLVPKGILDLYKLKVLKLEKCDRLVYAFTWSMASCLSRLESIEVKNCEMMETLIVDEEDNAARIIFSSLKNVFFEDMPKFSTIYSGRGDLECPSLYKITLIECPIIKTFFSTLQVFPNLKELSTDIKTVKGMVKFEAPSCCFSFLQILEVSHCNATTKSHASLVRFLSRLPNLDQLNLYDSSLKELFNSNSEEEAPTMPPIQSLKLKNLDDLNKISWHALSCASFQNLATLEVVKCNQLMNLNITPTVVRNMVQLKELRVSYCKMLNEIVGDASDHSSDKIVFTNLVTLKLDGLQSLQAFSLTRYNFKFPCLNNVIFCQCSNLRIFCHGIVETPKLNCVKDSPYSGNTYWEGDLNTTTKNLYQKTDNFMRAQEIKLSVFPVLKEKWDSQFPIRFLSSLERLEVDNCELFTNAIPSHLLQHLRSLKVMVVEKCYLLEQVFELEGLNANEYGINRMRNLAELQLIDLPRLKQVWSKDPQQILSFKNLQKLKVHNCGSLTFIFNLSMALSLQNLQYLEVKSCSLVEHIIVIAEEETMHKYQTVFPSLKSMTVLHLTHLLSFCSTSGVVECPSLKMLKAVDCPNLEMFATTFSEGQDSSIIVEDPDSLTGLLGNKMVVPRLEELKVEWKTLKDGIIDNYQSAIFSKLNCIELACFQGEKYADFPPFLDQFLKLEKLALDDSLIEEIKLDDLGILENKDPESVALLTKLKLSKLPNLKHLVRHDCLSIPLFKNLTDLEVLKCEGLINLISASVGKSLVQLRRMSVKDCKMMREIVANASDGEEYEIRFSHLQYLELDGLQCITCFSSGNHNFHFPSLQEVVIIECPNMRNFVKRVSVNTKLRKIKTGRHKYDWEWEGSLSDTIRAVYMEKVAEGKTVQNTSQKLMG